MIGAGDLIRAAHLAASVLPAGLYIFALLVARPAARAVVKEGGSVTGDVPAALRAWMIRILRWCVPAAFLTGALWVGVEAVSMSGEPVGAALTPDVVGAVIGATLFGHVLCLRAVLLAGLAVCVFRPASRQTSAASDGVGLMLAGAFAVTLAWIGHAAGMEGAEGTALLGSQIAHLAAATGWLGALPALGAALVLSRGRPDAGFAAAVTRRFSPLGVAAVSVLVLSGIVNSCILVGSIPALLGTTYGHVLLVKLALVLAMLGLAAVNRLWWTPRLDHDPGRAARGLAWTVGLETALGFGVLLVVGVLSVSTPAMHMHAPFRPMEPMPHMHG